MVWQGKFQAQSDDGQEFEIHIWADEIDVSTRAGRATELGMRRLRTSNGMSVNREDRGIYEIVPLGLTVRSNDPLAP